MRNGIVGAVEEAAMPLLQVIRLQLNLSCLPRVGPHKEAVMGKRPPGSFSTLVYDLVSKLDKGDGEMEDLVFLFLTDRV